MIDLSPAWVRSLINQEAYGEDTVGRERSLLAVKQYTIKVSDVPAQTCCGRCQLLSTSSRRPLMEAAACLCIAWLASREAPRCVLLVAFQHLHESMEQLACHSHHEASHLCCSSVWTWCRPHMTLQPAP